jgi:predicted PurR-regulated permease PerM
MATNSDAETLRNIGLSVIALAVVLAGLIYGRSFLIPLAFAILLWNLLEALIEELGRIPLGPCRMPGPLAVILAIAVIGIFIYLVAYILLGQADAIAAAWPRYEARVKSMIAEWAQWLGPVQSAKVRDVLSKFDAFGQVSGLFVTVQSFVLAVALVVLYVGFLLAESSFVGSKIAAMLPSGDRAHNVNLVLSAISGSVRRYIWIKTLVSALTGGLTYVVLHAIGVDFAETWSLLIFFLNYIPNVGSVLGVAFPALLALLQFNTFGPFLAIALGLTTVHLIIGNVVEPMLMGHSLNMSSFAIILALTFWGTIWGVLGMFLSVPIMVLIMIVCANVPSWRWVAQLLSKDGQIDIGPHNSRMAPDAPGT